VARQAGVSHQAPYKHFANREEILATLVAEGFDGLTRATDEAWTGQPRQDLVLVGRAYVRWALAHPGAYRLLFRPDVVPYGHPIAGPAATRAFAGLSRLVDQLIIAGAILPEAREPCLALFWSAVHGLASLLIDGPLPVKGSTLGVDQLVDEAVGQLSGLLRGDQPR
jgi:AcrR family transcriptional regulator